MGVIFLPREALWDSQFRVSVEGWSHGHPLPSMYQNSKHTEREQGLSINPLVCTNTLGPVSHSFELIREGREHSPNRSSQMSAKGQPCKQAIPRTAVSPLVCELIFAIHSLGPWARSLYRIMVRRISGWGQPAELISMVPCMGPSQSQLKHIPLATKVCLRKPSAFLHNFLYEPFFFFFFFLTWPEVSVQGPAELWPVRWDWPEALAGLRQCQNSQGTHPRSTIPEGALETKSFRCSGTPRRTHVGQAA